MEGERVKVIANLLQIIPTVGGFVASGTINRRKQTILSFIFCIIQSIVYLLLKAYRGMASVLFFAVKNLYLLIFHKEEKIVLKPIEYLLIGIPLIVIGILGYAGGGLLVNIFCGIADFTDANIYVIKNEITRFSIQIVCVIIWGIYMLQIGNYVGVVEYGITVMIFIFNIIRLVKNNENKYYKEGA